jgi:hypothetical protein
MPTKKAAEDVQVSVVAEPATFNNAAIHTEVMVKVPAMPQEPVYTVTLVLDPQTALDETRLDLRMTASEIRTLLAGKIPFIELPARYSRHPTGYDSQEAIFLSIEAVHQVRIAGWPQRQDPK